MTMPSLPGQGFGHRDAVTEASGTGKLAHWIDTLFGIRQDSQVFLGVVTAVGARISVKPLTDEEDAPAQDCQALRSYSDAAEDDLVICLRLGRTTVYVLGAL